jgi:HlyD family secretion protein
VKRILSACSLVAAMVLVTGCGKPEAAPPPIASDIAAAAPGRLEGARDTHRVGTNAQGVVHKLYVENGSKVRRGQLLVEIDCRREQAELSALTSRTSAAQARHRLLQQGYRVEEIAEAAAQMRTAEAEGHRAAAQLARMKTLAEKKMVSETAYDAAHRDDKAAAAALDRAKAREALLKAGYRRDEVAEAAANVAALEGDARATQSKVASCKVYSPTDGEVLRTHVTEGELVAPFNPQPLVTIADTSRLRVRAEVDERDVRKIRVGQRARVLLDDTGFPALEGTVEEVLSVMGKKSVFPPDPREKQDRDVLEVIVGLDAVERRLPLNLRVTVHFLPPGT